MANRIQLLEETTANRIAAGEVIERPASVVKELVENALDAGAKKLRVEIQRGGKSLIRVSDDGFGMSYDDALLCLERHATSKLRCAEDLDTIGSFGFRGEALPSIASVSKFRLTTREPESVEGTEIVIDGGRILEVKKAGCPIGTTVEVRSLFFHTPGRRKFLRADETEWAQIEHYLRQVALSQPGLDLAWKKDGLAERQLPSCGDAAARVAALLGREWMQSVLEIGTEDNGLRLTGWIGKPGVSRGSRQEQILFVNGRPVSHAGLNYALAEGYNQSLMKGRFPVALLFLTLPSGTVDVNVHPSKREVRFRQDGEVRAFVAESVAARLRAFAQDERRKVLPPASEPKAVERAVTDETPREIRSLSASSGPLVLPQKETERPLFGEPEAPGVPQVTAAAQVSEADMDNHDLRIIGPLMDDYILAQNEGGLVLVDHRAAYERILFERLLHQALREEAPSQRLLLPVTLEVTPLQAGFLRRQLEVLEKLGLGVSDMGGNSFLIDAMPAAVQTQDVEGFFLDLLEELREEAGSARRTSRLDEEAVARQVSLQASRRRGRLNEKEVGRLLADLHACDLPYTSPGGRPTMIMLSKEDLARKFGRL
jgi:DNA mismatch repair protein MutL